MRPAPPSFPPRPHPPRLVYVPLDHPPVIWTSRMSEVMEPPQTLIRLCDAERNGRTHEAHKHPQ
jgi:hypothetical protein